MQSAAELSAIRRDVEALMTHRCTIARGTRATYDTAASNAAHLSDVRCLYVAATTTELTTTSGVRLGQTARLLVPAGTDIAADDRVTAITDETGASMIQRPTAVDGEPIDRRSHLEVLLEGAS